MRQRAKKGAVQKSPPETLTGWNQIAAFLGEPTSVVQRWASEGMPVRRQGRYSATTPDELNAWLGKESGKPVYVATEDTDLTAELKRGARSRSLFNCWTTPDTIVIGPTGWNDSRGPGDHGSHHDCTSSAIVGVCAAQMNGVTEGDYSGGGTLDMSAKFRRRVVKT